MPNEIAPPPWTQKDFLSPIYDANGKVVSFQQVVERVVGAVNLCHELANHTTFEITQTFSAFRQSAQAVMEK